MNRNFLLLWARARTLGVQARSVLYLVSLGAVLSGVLTWRATWLQKSVVFQELELRGRVMTKNLAQAAVLPIVFEDSEALRTLIREARKQEDVLYIVLRDAEDKILVEDRAADVSAPAVGGPLAADEVIVRREAGALHILSGVQQWRQKKVDFTDIFSLETASPKARERVPLGALQLGLSTRRGEKDVRRFVWQSAAGTTGVLALGGLMAFLFFNRGVIRPLEHLVDATREIGRGNLDKQVDAPTSAPEFHILATSFNKMVMELRRAKEELIVANQDLEGRVQERTQALERANKDLLTVNMHLKELLSLRARFVSMVSHELRTPLASIKGFALTLLRFQDRFPPEKVRQYTEIIRYESERLARLIEDLLDISRIQEGRVEIHPQRFDFTALCRRVSERYQLKQSRVTFPVVAPPGPAETFADPDKVEQILVNLYDNALRFSPPGGAITTTLFQQMDAVVAEVADDGPGLPPGDAEKIFEPFYRVDNEINTRNPGTGLGLAISRSLSEAMGGKLLAGNREPKGACFALVLPQSGREQEEEETENGV